MLPVTQTPSAQKEGVHNDDDYGDTDDYNVILITMVLMLIIYMWRRANMNNKVENRKLQH